MALVRSTTSAGRPQRCARAPATSQLLNVADREHVGARAAEPRRRARHSDGTPTRRSPRRVSVPVTRRVDPLARPSVVGDRWLVPGGESTSSRCSASAPTFGVPGRAVSRKYFSGWWPSATQGTRRFGGGRRAAAVRSPRDQLRRANCDANGLFSRRSSMSSPWPPRPGIRLR